MMEKCIYLDNAATTFPKPECVYRAVDEAGRTCGVNAGRGSYALAKKVSDMIGDTREQIKRISGADEVAEVVFTASATLACNQILGGLDWKKEDTVYVSLFEHNAVMRVLYHYQQQYGFAVEQLALEEGKGMLDVSKIQFQFTRKPPTVVIMSHVSNVTGYILPIAEIAQLASSYEATVIVDGSQALGLVPFHLAAMLIDFYVFAGHKTLYGPFGVGGFLTTGRVPLAPVLFGGTGSDSLNLSMPKEGSPRYEPGSPNTTALFGLHASLKELPVEELFLKEQEFTGYLREKLSQIHGVTCYVPADEKRQVGIVAFNISGYKAADVGMLLDEDYGIAVRTGYQCAPLIHAYLKDEEYAGVVRVGIGRFTTKEELDALFMAVREIAKG